MKSIEDRKAEFALKRIKIEGAHIHNFSRKSLLNIARYLNVTGMSKYHYLELAEKIKIEIDKN
jgi:hypothetical protein